MFSYPLRKPVTLEIQVPEISDTIVATEISEAIRHHFRFLLSEHKRDTAIFIRERRTALALTIVNFLIALIYIGYAYQHENWDTTIAGIFIGGLVIIMNWATVWDTYEFFIFDGREKSQRRRLLTKIIDGEIRVVLAEKNQPRHRSAGFNHPAFFFRIPLVPHPMHEIPVSALSELIMFETMQLSGQFR